LSPWTSFHSSCDYLSHYLIIFLLVSMRYLLLTQVIFYFGYSRKVYRGTRGSHLPYWNIWCNDYQQVNRVCSWGWSVKGASKSTVVNPQSFISAIMSFVILAFFFCFTIYLTLYRYFFAATIFIAKLWFLCVLQWNSHSKNIFRVHFTIFKLEYILVQVLVLNGG
jgi:sensor histidine kinase YesM